MKYHIYTMDGTVKDYDINPDSFSFDYMKYLYKFANAQKQAKTA